LPFLRPPPLLPLPPPEVGAPVLPALGPALLPLLLLLAPPEAGWPVAGVAAGGGSVGFVSCSEVGLTFCSGSCI
jgi:hypothetical protein